MIRKAILTVGVLGFVLLIAGGVMAEETFTEFRAQQSGATSVDVAVINESSWVVAYEQNNALHFQKTEDTGQTWTNAVQLLGLTDFNFALDIEVQNESVYGIVADTTDERITLYNTSDGGATWSNRDVIDTADTGNDTHDPRLAISPTGQSWTVTWKSDDNVGGVITDRFFSATSQDHFDTAESPVLISVHSDGPGRWKEDSRVFYTDTDELVFIGDRSDGSGCACGQVWKSTNNGDQWTLVGSTSDGGNSDISKMIAASAIDSNTIGVVGTTGEVTPRALMFISVDGGVTWIESDTGVTIDTPLVSSGLVGFNSATWAASFGDGIDGLNVAKTTDGGDTFSVNQSILDSGGANAQSRAVARNATTYLISTVGTRVLLSDVTEIGDPLIILTPTAEQGGFNDLTDIRTDWSIGGSDQVYVRDPRSQGPTIGEVILMDPSLATITASLTCDGAGGMNTPDTELGLYVTKDGFVIEACSIDGDASFDISPSNLQQTDEAVLLAALSPTGVIEARTLNNVTVLEADNEKSSLVDFANIEGQWVRELNHLDADLSKTGGANTALVGTFGTRLISSSGLTLAADSGKTAGAVAVNGSTVYAALETANLIERLDRSGSSFVVNGSAEFTPINNGLRLSKDGRILFAWDGDEVAVINASSMELVNTIDTGLTNLVAVDISFANDNLYVANGTTVQRYDITPLGFESANFTKEVTEETTLEGESPGLEEFEEPTEGPLGTIIQNVSDGFGIPGTAIAILFGLLMLAGIIWRFSTITDNTVVLGGVVLVAVAALHLLGLFPLWLLFVVGFFAIGAGAHFMTGGGGGRME